MTNSRNSNQLIPYARSAMVPMGLYALDALLRQTPGVITAGARALGRGATNYLDSTSASMQQVSRPAAGTQRYQTITNGPSRNNSRRNRGRKKSIPRNLSSNSNIRTTIPLYISVQNTGAGVMGMDIWLGYKNTNAGVSLGTSSTPFQALSNTFQTVTFHSVTVSYVPTCGDTTTGDLAICFNPNHKQLTAALNQQQIIERRGCLTDVKAPMVFKWVPDTEQEREAKNTDEAAGLALSAVGEGSLRAFAPGYIRAYSTNSLAGSVAIGSFLIQADVTFSDLY